jgi:hypothetical protein
MKTSHRLVAIATIATFLSGGWMSAAIAAEKNSTLVSARALGVARLTNDGKLEKPADLERWVFLGASLGMGYNPGSFNAARPGQFQVVLMEPNAYRHFLEHGSYAPGSMFVLSFYDTDTQPRSLNQKGFTQAELTNYEIHLIDPASPDGHTFYMFDAGSKTGQALPPGNGCVSCHKNHGAFRGTFAQFYPTLRPHLPRELLEKASRGSDIR